MREGSVKPSLWCAGLGGIGLIGLAMRKGFKQTLPQLEKKVAIFLEKIASNFRLERVKVIFLIIVKAVWQTLTRFLVSKTFHLAS